MNRREDEKDRYAEEPVWPLGNRRESWEAAGETNFISSLIGRFFGGPVSLIWPQGGPIIYFSLWIVCSSSKIDLTLQIPR